LVRARAVVVNLLMPKSQQHMNMINMNAKELNLVGGRLRVEHFEAGAQIEENSTLR